MTRRCVFLRWPLLQRYVNHDTPHYWPIAMKLGENRKVEWMICKECQAKIRAGKSPGARWRRRILELSDLMKLDVKGAGSLTGVSKADFKADRILRRYEANKESVERLAHSTFMEESHAR